MYVPKNQTVADTPERQARRWRRLADLAGRTGSYAAVSLVTALAIYPELRFAVIVLAGNLLMLGIAIGTSLRWRAS